MRLHPARGQVNWLVPVFVTVFAAGVYLASCYLPHWITNREVVSAMREVGYQAWRIRDDDQLRRMIRSRAARLVRVDDGTGEYAVIGESDIEIAREGTSIVIELSYEVPMRFRWTDRLRTIRFDNRIEADTRHPLE